MSDNFDFGEGIDFVCNILPLLEKQEEVCIHRGEGQKYELGMTEEVAEQIVDACLTRLM